MEFFTWLFDTQEGMIALILGGMVIFVVIAFIAERRTRMLFVDHTDDEDDDDDDFDGLFNFNWDDDEDEDEDKDDDDDDEKDKDSES